MANAPASYAVYRGFESHLYYQNLEIIMTTFKKFQPMTLNAGKLVQDLITRGGTILVDKKEFVLVKRMQSVAKVDQYGRVEWRPE